MDAKAVVSTVGGRGHESWAERGCGMEVTEHGLKDLTGPCLLCAPQVSPDSSSPSFFTSASSVSRGCFGFSRAQATCHNAPSRGPSAHGMLKGHLA